MPLIIQNGIKKQISNNQLIGLVSDIVVDIDPNRKPSYVNQKWTNFLTGRTFIARDVVSVENWVEVSIDRDIVAMANATITTQNELIEVSSTLFNHEAAEDPHKQYKKHKYTEIVECETEISSSAANKNYELVQEVLNDLENTGGQIHFKGGGFFNRGFKTPSRILLSGESENAPVIFRPQTPSQTFFFWSARKFDANGNPVQGSLNTQNNSELQLEACGAEKLTILSNRQQFANCFLMAGCDHGYMRDVQVRGFKGYSWDAQHVREFIVDSFITRYNGYTNPDDPTDTIFDVRIGGSLFPPRENSNLNTWNNVQITFSFGPQLIIDGAFYNSLDGFLLHQLARGNRSLEGIVVALYGGQMGWDSDGVPRNEYAALHAGAPNVTAVNNTSGTSARRWKRGFAATTCLDVKNNARSFRLDNGRVIGGNTTNAIRVDNQSSLTMGQVDCASAGAGIYNVTFNIETDIFTVDSIVGGNLETLPETGSVVEISQLTTSPTPFILGRRGYLIRVSDTTGRIAATYQDAINGTAIDITSAGSGVQLRMGGELIYTTRSSQVTMAGIGEYNNGRVVGASDESSLINRTMLHGTDFTAGPQLPTSDGEVKLFIARNVNMNTTSDVTLRKIFSGHAFQASRVVIARSSGGVTTNSCVGGIYTGTNKSGTQVLNANTSYSSLRSQFDVLDIGDLRRTTIASSTGVAVSGNTGNGTIGTISATAGAKIGAYRVVLISANRFLVFDPDGIQLPTIGTVGTAYNVSNIQFTITAGGTAFIAGDSFTVTVTGSNLARLTSTLLYWSPTTASGSDMYADIHVYGRVID